MKNIIMYAHGGSGNHGCEAIIRSTSKMFYDFSINKNILISRNSEEDIHYGLSEICEIESDTSSHKSVSLTFLNAYLQLKLLKNFVPMDKLNYIKSFNKIRKGDIAISVGGDNYCYADVQTYIIMHELALEKGAKTILWGCSIEPDIVQKPEIAIDLSRYDLITARETITYNAIKKVNPNTVLVVDPAFTLPTDFVGLPEKFKINNMVGINISPMVIENEIINGITYQNYKKLINSILIETNMGIALIPHVVQKNGDDRIPLSKLYEEYKDTGRVLLIGDCNCMKLKGIISACRFFVGARTHATIAAYSTGIPALVVGYSVKARGIAEDLFGSDEGYVLSVQKLKKDDELVKAFKFIQINEEKIREHLKKIMPMYCRKAYLGTDRIKKMYEI